MKSIVFVKKEPKWRIYKIVKAIKQTGKYRLYCVCEKIDIKLYSGMFDKIYFYNNKHNGLLIFNGFNTYFRKNLTNEYYKKIVTIINDIKPDVIHCMAEPYDIVEYLIKNTNYPVVLDAIDFSGISSGINNLSKKVRLAENFCFENAAGICHKGPKYEIDYYRKQGYSINSPNVTWLDYTDSDYFMNSKAQEKDIIKLVYAGNISTNSENTYVYYIPLAKIFARQGIDFYLYVNPFQFRTSDDYQELNKNENKFHFEKSIEFNRLSKKICQYDWGLWVHPVWGQKHQSRITQDKQKVAIGNKLFSYLEAGLPIIVSDHLEYGKEIVEKYNIGFSIKDEDLHLLREKILSKDYHKLKQNVLKVREELSLKNKVKDLERFYDEVISYKSRMK